MGWMGIGLSCLRGGAVAAPLFGGDGLDFGGEAADVVAFFGGDHAHAVLLGDAAGGGVGGGFGDAHLGEAEGVEPEVGDGGGGFGHEALALPGEAEPEAAIVVGALHQGDEADELGGVGLEAERPVPLVAAGDGGEGDVAVEGEGSVGGVGPGDAGGEEADDLPVGEEALGLLGVVERGGAEDEARGFELGDHVDSI